MMREEGGGVDWNLVPIFHGNDLRVTKNCKFDAAYGDNMRAYDVNHKLPSAKGISSENEEIFGENSILSLFH